MLIVASVVEVQVYFHGWVATILKMVLMCHCLWQKGAFVHICSLIDAFLGARVELDHHCAVHLGPCNAHGLWIERVEVQHSCLCVALSRLRGILSHLEHVRVVVTLLGVIDAFVLQVVLVGLLGGHRQLGALV